MKTVGIVGAGISGLSCAQRLRKAGVEVTLFDKGRRAGGRIATRAHGQETFDSGAQYFTARDPRFQEEVDRLLREGAVAVWEARVGTLDAGQVTPEHDSPRRLVGVTGMNSLPGALARGLNLHSGVKVAQCARSPDGTWVLTSDADQTLGHFDALVVSAPAPQAAVLLEPVPALAEALAQIDFEPCWTVMLTLEAPLGLPLDGIFIQNSPLRWASRESSKPGRPPGERWVLHGSGEASRAVLEEPSDRVVAHFVEAFREALGERHELKVSSGSAHRWRYSRPSTKARAEPLWDGALRAGACGDGLAGGRVEGAFLSGFALAEAMLPSLQEV